MRIRRSVRPLLVAAAALCAARAGAGASPRYGAVTVGTDSTACLAMAGPELAPGTPLFVVFDDPQLVLEAVVAAVLDSACAPSSGVEGVSYALRLAGGAGPPGRVGVGVFCPGARAYLESGAIHLQTPGARTPLTIAACASTEGLHLTAWRGNRRVWHAYYYLGYDLEPDCTDRETRE